jgi:hypothetical protein
MVPAMMITSACLGVALATSKPNLEKSYFAKQLPSFQYHNNW